MQQQGAAGLEKKEPMEEVKVSAPVSNEEVLNTEPWKALKAKQESQLSRLEQAEKRIDVFAIVSFPSSLFFFFDTIAITLLTRHFIKGC